jgi:hypothetical protein
MYDMCDLCMSLGHAERREKSSNNTFGVSSRLDSRDQLRLEEKGARDLGLRKQISIDHLEIWISSLL